MTQPQVTGRTPIDIGADRWILTGTGDPSSGAGIKAAPDSLYIQTDSSPVANAQFTKIGLAQTAWTASGSANAAPAPLDNTGATDVAPLFEAWLVSKKGEFGGDNYLPTGQYKFNGQTLISRDDLPYLHLKGDGLGTKIVNGTAQSDPDIQAMLYIKGTSTASLKRVTIEDLRVSGLGITDAVRLLALDNIDEVHLRNIYVEENNAEGIFSSGNSSIHHVLVTDFRANNVGFSTGRAALNLNADDQVIQGLMVRNSGSAIEVSGAWLQVSNFDIENCNYGLQVTSTYCNFYTADNVLHKKYGADIGPGIIRDCHAHAIHLPDFTTRANPDYPTTGLATIPGSFGHVRVHDVQFFYNGTNAWGGADQHELIEWVNNTHVGQKDEGAGPQNPCISPNAGYWWVHHNTFKRGPEGEQWTSIIGYTIVGGDNPKKQRWENNIILDNCYQSHAFQLLPGMVVKDNVFRDLDGYIAANPTHGSLYWIYGALHSGDDDGVQLRGADFDYKEPHQIDIVEEQTRLVLNSDTMPISMSFKPGDRLDSKFSGATWTLKRCLTGGTYNITALTMTGTGVTAGLTLTVSAAQIIYPYSWISIVGVTGPRRVLSISGSVLTLESALGADVTGAAVSWAAPTWATV